MSMQQLNKCNDTRNFFILLMRGLFIYLFILMCDL